MILGALLDAGLPLDDLRRALGTLAVDRDSVWTERVTRAGITATKFHVRGETAAVDHAHDHSHSSHEHAKNHSHSHATGSSQRHAPGASPESMHHHSHRSLADIYQLIAGSSLSAPGKARAKELFARLGEAEAEIHGTSMDKVHLHEVGALDSIIDIVGTVYALETLGVDRIVSSPLNVGSGSIRSAHGLYPVPAPATARLLAGAPIYSGPQQAEMVTPTGALLITGYAGSYGSVPAMRLTKTAYGAGSRDFHDTPNVLRVMIGEADSTAPSHSVVVIEADIDDMNPQIFGALMDRLLAEGALDVFYTPIQMKKNRPGVLLSVLCAEADADKFAALVLRETSAFGVRRTIAQRRKLQREWTNVKTSFGEIKVKLGKLDGKVVQAAPEFESCRVLAENAGVPLKSVYDAALRAVQG